MPLYSASSKKKPLFILTTASIMLLLLTAAGVRAQIAIQEVNGSFPSSNATKNFHGYIVFLDLSSRQFTPLVINPIGRCPDKYYAPLMPTYEWAQQAGAFLALNGSFINPPAGEYLPGDCRLAFGPVKSNGFTVAPPVARPDGKGNPALLFARDGTASIKLATKVDVDAAFNVISGQWEAGPQEGSNGSLLITSGMLTATSALPVPNEVAPRTAVGLTKTGILLLVMIEGRLPDSDGITLSYLAQLLKLCGAYNAVNLDGGGSSTMTYLPDAHVHMRESLALYELMKLSQSEKTDVAFSLNFTQRDPRLPFASRPSNSIPPTGSISGNESSSDSSAKVLLYRPVGIHFGFAAKRVQKILPR
jgi:hypothetical protein